MKGIIRAFLLLVVFGLSAVPKAQAVPITIEIEAVVDSVGDDGDYLEGKINVGDIITGFYTYESTTPDSSPSSTHGRYEHYSSPCGIFLSAGGFDFQTDLTDVDFLVEIGNDHPPYDDYLIRSHNNSPLSNGTLVDSISWHLHDPTGNALSSDILPATPPILNDWQSNSFAINGYDRTFGISAYVTSAIPEPATIVLFGLGGLLLKKRK